MNTDVQLGDLLQRVDLTMDETIGRVILDGGVHVGKLIDVGHGHPIVKSDPRCLAVGWHPGGRNGKVR